MYSRTVFQDILYRFQRQAFLKCSSYSLDSVYRPMPSRDRGRPVIPRINKYIYPHPILFTSVQEPHSQFTAQNQDESDWLGKSSPDQTNLDSQHSNDLNQYGLGSMGLAMATNLQRHLATKGALNLVYSNRTMARGDTLKRLGAVPEPSFPKLVAQCRIIFTMVAPFYPEGDCETHNNRRRRSPTTPC